MPRSQRELMQALYGNDIWRGFNPRPTSQPVAGWNGNHPSLRRLAAESGTKTVIDVGVFKGQSTITLAQGMKESHLDGCVIAIDTFLGSVEHWDWKLELFTRAHGMPDLLQTFMSNVYASGVQDYIIPMPQTSTNAALILQQLGVRATVVHIDAAHEYEQVLRDIEEYW